MISTKLIQCSFTVWLLALLSLCQISQAQTHLVKDISKTPLSGTNTLYDPQILGVNGIAFFNAYSSATGVELWKTDGSSAGTTLVKDITKGIYGSSVKELTNVNGVLYFVADNGYGNYGLWKTDGSESGTIL